MAVQKTMSLGTLVPLIKKIAESGSVLCSYCLYLRRYMYTTSLVSAGEEVYCDNCIYVCR